MNNKPFVLGVSGAGVTARYAEPSPANINGIDVARRNAVTAQVRALNAHAAELGQESGITQRLELNPAIAPKGSFGIEAIALLFVVEVLRAKYSDRCSIAVEAQHGGWGLYFTRVPAAVNHEAPKTVPLVDAPFEVREWFLGQSGTFFREYQKRCDEVFDVRRNALATGASTIAMLEAAKVARKR